MGKTDKQSGWATHFKVYAFSPDGAFTCEELKEYLNRGIQAVWLEKGIGFRMSPIEVSLDKEYEYRQE